MSYVVGDIHGELGKLKALVRHIPAGEKIVLIGDYIDKGEDPRGVVEFLLQLRRRRDLVFLIGNHEFKLLQAWQGHGQAMEFLAKYGFNRTLSSYIGKAISGDQVRHVLESGLFRKALQRHIDFFRSLRGSHEEDGYYVIHSGVPVDARGRFSVRNAEKNVFVREGFLRTRKKFRGKVVVFGHTAFRDVFWDGYKLGVDTGAVYPVRKGYGRLTAVDLKRFSCVDDEGRRSVPVLKDLATSRDVINNIRTAFRDEA